MKKICIIIPKGLPLPNVLGGAIETLVTDIANQNELSKKIDITCVSIYNPDAYKESKKYKFTKFIYIKKDFSYFLTGIKVRICNLFGNNFNTYNEVILNKIKNQKFDYIVVEDGAYMSFLSYLKYFKKEQMIVHFHHCGVSDQNTDNTFFKFVAVSDYVRNTFKESSTISNCVTLRNGIDVEKFNKDVSTKEKLLIRKKLGLKKDDFVVIFCGRLIQEKGILELVKSIKKIDNEKIKLLIVGSINFGQVQTSTYVEMLEQEINSAQDKIKFTGYVDNKEIYKYYKCADMGILPSVWEDAAPLVVFEMMACGLPVAITNSGGAPENVPKDTIIVSKENNLIEGLKNAIEKMYKNEKLRKKLSEEGLLISSKLGTKNFYDNFISLFK